MGRGASIDPASGSGRSLRDVVDGALERVADLDVLGDADPAGLVAATARTGVAMLQRPDRLVRPGLRSAARLTRITGRAAARAVGVRDGEDPAETDRRFADRAWRENAYLWWVRQVYDELCRVSLEVTGDALVDFLTIEKAEFALRQVQEAVAPSNLGLLNPAVARRAHETGGLSLVRGAGRFVDDVRHHGGRPSQVVPGQHEVGRTLAATEGRVVFRNDLMELIQYAPRTEQVHAVPLLCSPPWINKFYMMDLSPGRSLVEWAVDHGHTVFMISYRNPDAEMSSTTLDDYLLHGPVAALEVVAEVTGSDEVNLLSLCLGGTLAMATLAYLHATRDEQPERPRVGSAVFLNTLVDFDDAGMLGALVDSTTLDRIDRRMLRRGFLHAQQLQDTFNLLRSRDLIWRYVVDSWWMGDPPPDSDLLAWNNDGTRLPAAMHSFYLRSCYVENQLARGVMKLAGVRLEPAALTEDLYFVSAEQDHITPWTGCYRGAAIPAGDVRFVLSNSGHIAGVVNPPGPRSRHRALSPGEPLPREHDEWWARTAWEPGSWWEDWATWQAERAGAMVDPPRLGSDTHPPLDEAPGRYVRDV